MTCVLSGQHRSIQAVVSPAKFCLSAFFSTAMLLSPIASAATPQQIDSLTEQWLNLSKQERHLTQEWQASKPALQQRIRLLKEEKKRLQEVLSRNASTQDEVANQRESLLAKQSQLEKEQQQMANSVSTLARELRNFMPFLPPLIQKQWQENAPKADAENLSRQLQAHLSNLSLLAAFNQRITLHEGIIQSPSKQDILVKQLFIGSSFAWFASNNGEYSGWGSNSNTGWQWHISDDVDAQSVQQAIAIFEKQQPAAVIELPVTFSSPTGSSPSEPTLSSSNESLQSSSNGQTK